MYAEFIVEKVTDDGELEEVVRGSERPVLVNYYADWYVPSLRINSWLNEIVTEEKYGNAVKIVVMKIPPSPNPNYHVDRLPWTEIYKDGEVEPILPPGCAAIERELDAIGNE
ncbi:MULTISPECIES: thioredoxin domain-containing protein [Streptomyces]|uniref:Thioredoxin domain-containing protein n=1 Tax=Streptomyces ramulosus TaxID=47762 RepID=A0ABW1FQC3_9ACTN